MLGFHPWRVAQIYYIMIYLSGYSKSVWESLCHDSSIHFSRGQANLIHLITASSCNYPLIHGSMGAEDWTAYRAPLESVIYSDLKEVYYPKMSYFFLCVPTDMLSIPEVFWRVPCLLKSDYPKNLNDILLANVRWTVICSFCLANLQQWTYLPAFSMLYSHEHQP